ncbi:MAG: cache domain-containing protein [Rhodopila sp.]
MNRLLSRLKLHTKLTVMVGLSALALVVAVGVAGSLMYQRMLDDRVEKLRAVVQSVISIAQALENRVAAHQLTRDQALALLREDVHAMRFDGGSGYVFAQDFHGIMILHGTAPALEGRPSPPATDTNGRLLSDLILGALRDKDAATIAYLFARPGENMPQPKNHLSRPLPAVGSGRWRRGICR